MAPVVLPEQLRRWPPRMSCYSRCESSGPAGRSSVSVRRRLPFEGRPKKRQPCRSSELPRADLFGRSGRMANGRACRSRLMISTSWPRWFGRRASTSSLPSKSCCRSCVGRPGRGSAQPPTWHSSVAGSRPLLSPPCVRLFLTRSGVSVLPSEHPQRRRRLALKPLLRQLRSQPQRSQSRAARCCTLRRRSSQLSAMPRVPPVLLNLSNFWMCRRGDRAELSRRWPLAASSPCRCWRALAGLACRAAAACSLRLQAPKLAAAVLGRRVPARASQA
mmetsp:Transcript_68286/g.128964  ORF Transcript_68286/g.128964 Transcript_68286/m.128964 type:complete len:275 (-) Transcript_68286:36-860(-)